MFCLFNRKTADTLGIEQWKLMLVALSATSIERARILALANEAAVLADSCNDAGPFIEIDRLTDIVNQTGDFA